jgi:hypothetical protein
MNQVGHADSKMTLDVYAQLEQRADRSHGTSFDALIRRAAEPPKTTPEQLELPVDWATFGLREQKSPISRLIDQKQKRRRKRRFAGHSQVARPGLEPGTPRFSVVCSTN